MKIKHIFSSYFIILEIGQAHAIQHLPVRVSRDTLIYKISMYLQSNLYQ